MNCCTNNKYQKSALRTYNNATQTVTEELTPLQLVGSVCTDTGCSISANSNSAQILKSGLYYISANVIFTPTSAGVEIIQLYKDGVALPCAIAQETTVASDIVTMHVETVLQIATCNSIKPNITVNASGVAGGVNFVGVSVIKLA